MSDRRQTDQRQTDQHQSNVKAMSDQRQSDQCQSNVNQTRQRGTPSRKTSDLDVKSSIQPKIKTRLLIIKPTSAKKVKTLHKPQCLKKQILAPDSKEPLLAGNPTRTQQRQVTMSQQTCQSDKYHPR